MATSVTQNPANVVKIAYGAFAYTGYCPENISSEGLGNIENVFCDGSLLASIISNIGNRISGTLIILNAGSLTPPAVGSVLTITPPEGTEGKYLAQPGCKVDSTTGAARLTIVAEKYVGATYA